MGAIVGGQTSCKAPELAAFEKHLPDDVEIISCHSLHGPNVDTKGQPLVWSEVILRYACLVMLQAGPHQASSVVKKLRTRREDLLMFQLQICLSDRRDA